MNIPYYPRELSSRGEALTLQQQPWLSGSLPQELRSLQKGRSTMKEKGKEKFQLVIGSNRAIQCKTLQEAKHLAKLAKEETVHLYIWKGTGKKERLVKYV